MSRLTEAHATALAIAERKLNALGFRWGAREVGEFAAVMLLAMDAKIAAGRAALQKEQDNG